MNKRTKGTSILNEHDGQPIDIQKATAKQNGNPYHVLNVNVKGKSNSKKSLKGKMIDNQNKVPSTKERMTVQISNRTIQRVKNAVYWTPGLTIAQLTEEALELALDRLEKKAGKPFQKRKSELKPGRPIK